MLESLPGWTWGSRRRCVSMDAMFKAVGLDAMFKAPRRDAKWTVMFEAVGKWVRMHQGEGEGVNVRYPSQKSKDKDEKKLAIWVKNQLSNYHGKRGRVMNESRREMLENLPGWKWTATSVKESNS